MKQTYATTVAELEAIYTDIPNGVALLKASVELRSRGLVWRVISIGPRARRGKINRSIVYIGYFPGPSSTVIDKEVAKHIVDPRYGNWVMQVNRTIEESRCKSSHIDPNHRTPSLECGRSNGNSNVIAID